MADFKRRILYLSTGKQIKFYGNSVAISPALEIGEGAAPNIFSFLEIAAEEKPVSEPIAVQPLTKPVKEKAPAKPMASVQNPHRLSLMELLELADYSIQLWMNLKENIRKYGVANPKVFNREQS